MDTATQLRQTVADFFQVEEAQVGSSFSLQSRQGSIARSALDAAIRRRVGVKSAAVYSAKTFGELAVELGVGSTEPIERPANAITPASPAAAPTASGLASCGIDIELIEHLPIVADPWEDAFYRANFAPSEIAYCLRQPEPALHFAARWCAKEALKKADRLFLMIDGKDIEVVPDESGAPHLVHHQAGGATTRLPHAVSLSHTTHAAVAVVVRVDSPPPLPVDPVIAAPPVVPVVVEAPRPSRRLPAALLLLNLIALMLAAAAFAWTVLGFRWPFWVR